MIGLTNITITPYSGAWQDGAYVPSPGQPYTLLGTVVPVPGMVAERLPEGARSKARWQVFIAGKPAIKTAGSGGPADRVTVDGVDYVPIALSDYSYHTSGLAHSSYVLVEVGYDET